MMVRTVASLIMVYIIILSKHPLKDQYDISDDLIIFMCDNTLRWKKQCAIWELYIQA